MYLWLLCIIVFPGFWDFDPDSKTNQSMRCVAYLCVCVCARARVRVRARACVWFPKQLLGLSAEGQLSSPCFSLFRRRWWWWWRRRWSLSLQGWWRAESASEQVDHLECRWNRKLDWLQKMEKPEWRSSSRLRYFTQAATRCAPHTRNRVSVIAECVSAAAVFKDKTGTRTKVLQNIRVRKLYSCVMLRLFVREKHKQMIGGYELCLRRACEV